MTSLTPNPTPFQAWLISRNAETLLVHSAVEIECMIKDPRDHHIDYPPPDSYISLLETAAITIAILTLHTDTGVIRWFPLTNTEAVQLLFSLEGVWDPIFWVHEGTEEQEEPLFGACVYWPELKEALGYEVWTDEQSAEWKLKSGYGAQFTDSSSREAD